MIGGLGGGLLMNYYMKIRDIKKIIVENRRI